MKYSICITVILGLMVLIGSCGKSTCLNPGIHVSPKGFDSLDLSRVLVAQYVSNTGFATMINIRVYDTAYTEMSQSNDTVYMPKFDTTGIYIAPGYDYIISFPAVLSRFFSDSVFKITEISYKQLTHGASKSGKGGCTNDASYYLDSIPYQVKGGSYTEASLPPVNIVLNK